MANPREDDEEFKSEEDFLGEKAWNEVIRDMYGDVDDDDINDDME